MSPGSPLVPKLNSSMLQRNKTDRADSLPDPRWPSLIWMTSSIRMHIRKSSEEAIYEQMGAGKCSQTCSEPPPKTHAGVEGRVMQIPAKSEWKADTRSTCFWQGVGSWLVGFMFFSFLFPTHWEWLPNIVLSRPSNCPFEQTTHRSNNFLFFDLEVDLGEQCDSLSFLGDSKAGSDNLAMVHCWVLYISDRSCDKVLPVQCLVPFLWRGYRPPDSLGVGHTLLFVSWSRLLPPPAQCI